MNCQFLIILTTI